MIAKKLKRLEDQFDYDFSVEYYQMEPWSFASRV